MIRVRNTAFPSSFFQPLMSPELAWTQESRNGIIQPVDGTSPFVTLRFPDTRSGTFEFLFPDRASMELARGILNQPARFLYENTDQADGEIRTNLEPNPGAQDRGFSDQDGTFTLQNGTGTDGAMLGVKYRTAIIDTPNTVSGIYFPGPSGTAGIPVTPFETYAVSAHVRQSADMYTAGVLTEWYDAGGAYLSPATSGGVDVLPPDTWSRRNVIGPAPAGAAFARVQVRFNGTGGIIGEQIFAGGILFEQSPEVGPYFDGDNTAPGGWSFWAGEQDASPSVWVPDGAERFEFVTIGNIEARRNMPYRSWMLRVPFREVI